jgi:ribosome-binding protein aMBF1 (putative translation factor)
MSPEGVAARFGRNLAEAREWAGLTQSELADQTALSQKEISVMERGMRCPRLDVVAKLADSLGVLLRDLLFEIE